MKSFKPVNFGVHMIGQEKIQRANWTTKRLQHSLAKLGKVASAIRMRRDAFKKGESKSRRV